MTDKEKINRLEKAFADVIWMAIRYAHGRHTLAPSTVRDAISLVKEVCPGFELKHDKTIKPPEDPNDGPMAFRSDWLDDLFEEGKD